MNEETLFQLALEKPAGQRPALLEEACGEDDALRQRVEVLLEAHDNPGSFLGAPAPELDVTAVRDVVTEKVGTLVGPYKLLEQIGEGGMGVVFMAQQTEPIRRKVALKIIKPGMDTRQVIARFEAERQVLALMDHPNIAKVLDAGSTGGGKGDRSNLCAAPVGPSRQIGPVPFSADDATDEVSDIRALDFPQGRPYFVMELVRGVPITEFCDDGNLNTHERLKLLAQVCRAVQHAHQKGIIHRDIKPGNVLVTMHDDRPVPKVIDFGVAKATNQQLTEQTLFTQFAQMIGTPLYMSPEQAQMNELDVDTRSDVYSLGVLLYELLTGSTPFDSQALKDAGYDEMRRIIREDEPPKPSERVSTLAAEALSTVSEKRSHDPRRLSNSLRGELDWIVLRAMEKDRTRRYGSASDLAADIERYLNDEPVQACPPSLGYRLRKFARRKRAALTMTSVVALAVLLVVGSLGWMVRDRDARQQAVKLQQTERQAKRQARVAGQVELILGDVDRLIKQHKWPAALATAKRAEALIAGGEVEEETETHVRQIMSDLAMVQRLDEIRLLSSVYQQKSFDHEGSDQAYTAAFRDFGIDVEELSEAESGKQCRARARVVVPLVKALDHWSRMRRKIDESDRGRWRRLVAIAGLVDSDPFRNRLRELWVEEPADAIKKKLAELAQSERLADQPAATFDFLAAILKRASMPAEAESVLRQAQQAYPADFWINFTLARTIQEQNPGDAEAIRFYSAALALRPGNTAVFNNLGNVFSDREKHDEAIACYRKAIEFKAKFAYPHNNLGVIFSNQGKLDEAIACYQKAIEVDPKFAAAHASLGVVFMEQGKLNEAMACLRKAIEIDPKYANAHTNLGNVFVEQGKLDEAMACHRKAIEIDPKNAGAHSNLGNVFKGQRKLDEAITCYETAIELGPKTTMAYFNLGEILTRRGKMDEAIPCFRKAIEIRPKELNAHYFLGLACLEQGKLDEAIDCFRIIIDIDPTIHLPYNCMAVTLHRQGRLDAAIKWYRKTLDLKPKFFLIHDNLGQVYRDLGKLDEAIACYRKALEYGPHYARAHVNLIYAFKDRGKLDQAITYYREFLEREPDYALAHHNLIEAFKERGKLDGAMTYYREAISRNSKYKTAYKYLANLLNDQGKLEEALVVLQAGAGANPKSSSFPRRQADIYRQQKKYDLALSSYDLALKLSPNYGTAFYHRGKVYCDQKKYDLALADFSHGLNAQPPSIACLVHVALFRLNCPDPKYRDTAKALRLAQQAVDLIKPRSLSYNLTSQDQAAWFALGQAHYRAGDYAAAIKALHESLDLEYERQAQSRFVLAMAHWKSGDQALARKLYQQAAKWMSKNHPPGAMFPQSQFRDEAEALIQPEKQIPNLRPEDRAAPRP